ncbi:MAG: D-alanyl-D-alanine carboxypeptidase/D-alanyl-D-alanine-endopeptidase [Spirochaetes bacterium]|nr:D-alanyl-D-alanine carboxypeptidase/D-alanyl-D-alanine-endopeptidase [Spirochaetota bacterium]
MNKTSTPMNNKISFLYSIILVFFLSCSGYRSDGASMEYEQTARELSRLIEEKLNTGLFKDVNVGIHISSVDGKHTLYSRDDRSKYITASVFKIIPSAIALIKLGVDHRFETPIMTDSEIKNGTLEGNLYLAGKGDPSLMIPDLEKAAQDLRSKGLKDVKGDIVYDISFLDEEKNRFSPNARNLYAPPCALNVNYNWLEVGIKDGTPVKLWLSPKTSYAKLTYAVKISKSASPGRPAMTYQMYEWGDHFTIKGTITAWDRQFDYVHLGASRPGLYAATLFYEICQKAGIRIKGRIKKGHVPKKAQTLYIMKGTVLKQSVQDMNQRSNNVIAEVLNKDLGARFQSTPGTREKGIAVLKDFCMKKIGLEKNNFSIGDASGLSVNNQFSPKDIARALNYFYRDPEIRKAFLPTLARQGHHPHAMNPVPPDDMVILVKTGTLSVRGVNTVAGFIIREKTKDVFSFAILANRKSPGPMTYSGTLTNPLLTIIVDVMK